MRQAIVMMRMVGAVAVLTLLAGCGGGEPEDVTFDVEIAGRKIVGESVFQVKQDDTVTLSVTVDEPGELHVHGYDRDLELSPGAPVSLTATPG